MSEVKTGVELIAAERRRQIEVEGWTAEHDAQHDAGVLVGAAGCYIAHALSALLQEKSSYRQRALARFQIYEFGELNFLVNNGDRGDRQVRKPGWRQAWPWDGQWWKPSPDNIKNLIKAGALIAAEIDRLNSLTP